MKQEITIDAQGKSIGRIASEVSKLLQGKHLADYEPNKLSEVKVAVANLSRVKFTGTKMATKVYRKHTGYIGHLKEEKLKEAWAKKPKVVFYRALRGMLPKNKLRDRWMRNVTVTL